MDGIVHVARYRTHRGFCRPAFDLSCKARRTAPLPKGAPLIPHNLVLTYIECRSKSGLDGIYSSLVLLFLIDCCISTVDTALFLMPIECKGDCSTLYHV